MTFTKQQLRKGFCGELYEGADYKGHVFLVEGRAYVVQIECGQVLSFVEKDCNLFRRTGKLQVSATRAVQKWELVGA